ncbi:adenosine deaminase [Actinoalloteichus hymeniacidonis]|uniref:Adenosine deaminase n=1 Tax=Actinoalloteichus hymeniacidonis TaxID=340345 RepID=A0AAC9N0Q4_9PSEU|nr:adenosine deaminase [Actinoalloteichus hymeniacidonis]AOS65655.1 adenosine deaminase [Actinoalloteichus hymeniacidonis]MBB5906255.1 adenosine deaminase [Actinoalloteichus hymeniacidonis]
MSTPVTLEAIRRAPKVLLHDHLDGGLRPKTVIELAEAVGYQELPSTDEATLAKWFRDAADSGSLVRYLETFAHTVAVMQTKDALVRVASECAQDLAADGVVYAEVRYAPELFEAGGLKLDEVVSALTEGFEQGSAAAESAGHRIRVGALLCAMRQNDRALEIAELAVRHRDAGVVGFDIAGPEDGFPPTRCQAAFDYLRDSNAHFTIHAGEAYGLPSIQEAVARCGTERIGHGLRIADDITVAEDGSVTLGRLAAYVRDRGIPLELCPSSNLQTGAAESFEKHPFGQLAGLGFRVTVNTDNRLMSGCTVSSEFDKLASTFDYGWDDIERFTLNAIESVFLDLDERTALIEDVIKPAYAALRA